MALGIVGWQICKKSGWVGFDLGKTVQATKWEGVIPPSSFFSFLQLVVLLLLLSAQLPGTPPTTWPAKNGQLPPSRRKILKERSCPLSSTFSGQHLLARLRKSVGEKLG